MQCNYKSFIQLINFHVFFCNALRCRKTGACRILVPLQYFSFVMETLLIIFLDKPYCEMYVLRHLSSSMRSCVNIWVKGCWTVRVRDRSRRPEGFFLEPFGGCSCLPNQFHTLLHNYLQLQDKQIGKYPYGETTCRWISWPWHCFKSSQVNALLSQLHCILHYDGGEGEAGGNSPSYAYSAVVDSALSTKLVTKQPFGEIMTCRQRLCFVYMIINVLFWKRKDSFKKLKYR